MKSPESYQPELPIPVAREGYGDDEPGNPEAYRFNYPESYLVQQQNVKKELQTRTIAETALSPYEELGGGITTSLERMDDPLIDLKRFLADSVTERDTDIIEGFEHFNLLQLFAPGKFRRMTEADKQEVAAHFADYMERLYNKAHRTASPGAEDDRSLIRAHGQLDSEAFRQISRNIALFLGIIRLFHEQNEAVFLEQRRAMSPRERQNQQRKVNNHRRTFYIVEDTKMQKLRVHQDRPHLTAA